MECATFIISEIIIIFEGAIQIFRGQRLPMSPPNCAYAHQYSAITV
jgi:hypothetical protein